MDEVLNSFSVNGSGNTWWIIREDNRWVSRYSSRIAAEKKAAAGDDSYFSWKCYWAVKRHGLDAMIAGLKNADREINNEKV